ncbi:hypothetical protein CEXT_190601 [Caerostris extrusa]|uniref:Uncharacterized protein n=1 Tax=Caerostris extrusa TaxID=172846 RepID=A0AAV4MG15_CAEEX|nr:hypothetical protein CEXT_190601 [Caerostris extrusa]
MTARSPIQTSGRYTSFKYETTKPSPILKQPLEISIGRKRHRNLHRNTTSINLRAIRQWKEERKLKLPWNYSEDFERGWEGVAIGPRLERMGDVGRKGGFEYQASNVLAPSA